MPANQTPRFLRADRHRLLDLALEPIRSPSARRFCMEEAVAALGRLSSASAHRFLATHGIDQIWLYRLTQQGLAHLVAEPLRERLQAARRVAAGQMLLRDKVLTLAADALDHDGIPYVVTKGLHLARTVYDDPLLRPAGDIDLLVAPDERDRAFATLTARGFTAPPHSTWGFHEIRLTLHGLLVELHLHPFRPGRARPRPDLTSWLLQTRQRVTGFWVGGDTATAALLLLHTALTEHVTWRAIRALDIDLWARRREVRWKQAARFLADTGLGAAAWAMLTWTQGLFGTPIPHEVWRSLQPCAARRAYLRQWLAIDPYRLYANHPWLVRGAFSLCLQDTARDVARAVWSLALAEREGARPAFSARR